MAKTMGASVSFVHNAVHDLLNKDQQGFVSDSEFTNLARLAQLNIFNGLFDELKDAQRTSRSGYNPNRDKSRIKRIQEDLAAFSKKATITKASGVFDVVDDATFDMSRIISISTAGSILLDQSTKKPIEICYDEEKIERILLNNLSAPTEDFPVALVSDDIYVFPTSINKIEIRYYRYPTGRHVDTGAVEEGLVSYTEGGDPVDFDLPAHYASDLIYEICRLVGVNLRDSDVIAYTGQEMATRKQAETL